MELYISSDEYLDFAIPRKILHFHKMIIDNNNILEVEADRSLIGQKYGLLDMDPYKFYLANRVKLTAFEKLDHFPIDVHILIIKDKSIRTPLSLDDLQHIAWGRLYDNEKDAKKYKI